MNKRSLGALIALNLSLLAGLAVTGLAPQPAEAQVLGSKHYVMVAGDLVGRNDQSVVYVIEIETSRMIAVLVDTRTNELQLLGRRNLQPDFNARGGPGGNGR